MLRSTHTIIAGLALSLAACAPGMNGTEADRRADSGLYDRWDLNTDGVVDQSEFDVGFTASGIFEDWDRDASGFVEQSEWYTGIGDSDATWGTWDTWDIDESQQVDQDEFTTAVFDLWDTDGDERVSEAELSAGMARM